MAESQRLATRDLQLPAFSRPPRSSSACRPVIGPSHCSPSSITLCNRVNIAGRLEVAGCSCTLPFIH
ncbi:hypothetical protein BsWGS_16571 [Bradybaena similaris]